jgi:hypothetical protein
MILRLNSIITVTALYLLLTAFINPAIAGSFETTIPHRYCDVEERLDGSITRSNGDLDMTTDGDDVHIVGLCFEGINLPPGAVVTNAYIQFTADESNELTPTDLTIVGHADANSPRFSRAAYTVSNRIPTTASVAWAPDPWINKRDAGPEQRTPNIASIVEEIIAIPGWQTGNSVAFAISGTGKRTAEAFNSSEPEITARLHIDFVGDTPNLPPTVKAGRDKQANFPAAFNLTGRASDDGLPNGTLTYLWEHVGGDGAGTVGFGDETAISTIASISDDPGTYILRITADDGEYSSSDEIELSVYATGVTGLNIPILWYIDDAEEDPVTGEVDRHSSDIELVKDSGENQTVGLRFQATPIPPGAIITSAYIQFAADEDDDRETNLIIWGQAANNATQFEAGLFNISNRPRTTTTASWSPTPWLIVGERGPEQRTSDLAAIVQEIVDRPGWLSGNSMAFITEGTGRRVGVSRNNNLANNGFLPTKFAPHLHVEFNQPGSNRKPVIDAGSDATIVFPTITTFLDATITDDGLGIPDGTLNTLWEHVGGTGTGVVSFGSPNAEDTPVSFTQNPGTYILRLTVDDGGYTVSDEVLVSTYFAGAVTSMSKVSHAHTGFDGVGNPLAVPSIDPAGIVYHEPSGTLFISDSEINEVAEAFDIVQANIFSTTIAVDSTLSQWDITPRQGFEPARNREPTGITFCPSDNHFYISNDDNDLVYRYAYDGFDLTLVDWMDIKSYTSDPEGITCDPLTGRLYIVGGTDLNVTVIEYNDGFNFIETLDLTLTAGDPDGVLQDGEGIAFDPDTGHLFILSDPDFALFEYTTSGSFIQKLSFSDFSPSTINTQGLSIGPATSDPLKTSFYISDGGVDNGTDPNERDGTIYEAEIERVE